MLQCAAATGAKMFADWFGALVARLIDMQQVPAVRMAVDGFDRHGLARQGVRHINKPFLRASDAISAMAEAADRELLSHVRPQAEIRRCHRRLRSVRG